MTWRRACATASVALGTLMVPWLMSACNSPTLPVPPPADPLNVPSAVLEADGEHVSLSGSQAWPGALVIIVNQSLLDSDPTEAIRGAKVDVEGKYGASVRVDLRCSRTNLFEIWQRNDQGFESTPRDFEAPQSGFEAGPSGDSPCSDAGSSNGNDGGVPDVAGDAGAEGEPTAGDAGPE